MRRRRKHLLALLIAAAVALLLPQGVTIAAYLHALRDLGELPRPSTAQPLPRLVELGIWQATGESANAFEVEATWPWTLVLDLARASALDIRRPRRTPGQQAASRLATMWLATKPPAKMGEWHLRRAALTVWLTRHWTASELTRELAARSYFGHGAVGIDAAARAYFGKTPAQLDVVETALLMALAEAPSRYDPFRHPDRALVRRNLVLRSWLDAGIITAEQAQAESAKPLGVSADRRPDEQGGGTLLPGGRPIRSSYIP